MRTWFYAMLLFANARSGLSLLFLSQHLGLSIKAANRLATRIRLHMTAIDVNRMIGGAGTPVRIETTLLRGVRTCGRRGQGRMRLLGLADPLHARAFPYLVRDRPRVWDLISSRIRPTSVLIVSDKALFEWLTACSHRKPELCLAVHFEPAIDASDPLDGYFITLKRWLRATHLHVRRDAVSLYLGEFEFRYNRRSQKQRTFDDMLCVFPRLEQLRRLGRTGPCE